MKLLGAADHEGMSMGTSHHGLRWAVDARPELESASIGVWVRAGSRNDPRGAEGLAHLVEHGVFHTAARGVLGAEHDVVDAWTGVDDVAYVATVDAQDVVAGGIELLRLVFDPQWEDEALLQECCILDAEMDSPDRSPVVDTVAAGLAALYPGQPFARNMFRGTARNWPLTPWLVRSFHRSFYVPSNAVLVGTGAVTAEQMAAIADSLVVLHSGVLHPPPPPMLAQTLPEWKAVSENAGSDEQVVAAVGIRSPSRSHPLQPAAIVAAQMLGGGPAARLQRDLRVERKFAYDSGAISLSYCDGGAMIGYAATKLADADEAVVRIQAHINDFAAGRFEDEEIRQALRRIRNAISVASERSLSRLRGMATGLLHQGRVIVREEHLERLSAVTRNDVQQALADAKHRSVIFGTTKPSHRHESPPRTIHHLVKDLGLAAARR